MKRFIILLGMVVAVLAQGALVPINVGSSANAGDGDAVRDAFGKVNSNEAWLNQTKMGSMNGRATNTTLVGNYTMFGADGIAGPFVSWVDPNTGALYWRGEDLGPQYWMDWGEGGFHAPKLYGALNGSYLENGTVTAAKLAPGALGTELKDFTVMQLPDLQYHLNCLPELTNTFNYILAAATTNNLKMVVLPGDLADVQNFPPPYDTEYITLTNQLWRLREAGIGLMAVPGNHDELTLWEKYVTPLLNTDPNFAESFTLGQTFTGTVVTQTVSGIKLAYIGIYAGAYQNQVVMDWAVQKARDYKDHYVIYVFHGYLNGATGLPMQPGDPAYGGGDVVWANVVSKAPNGVMVLSGHDIFSSPQTNNPAIADNGNVVRQAVFNYQWSPPYIGTGVIASSGTKLCGVHYARWYQISPGSRLVNATTWDNYYHTNDVRPGPQFTFPLGAYVEKEITNGLSGGGGTTVVNMSGGTGMAAPMDNGLVFYLTFDEGANGVVHDSSAFGDVGTIETGTTNWVAAGLAKQGKALNLWSNTVVFTDQAPWQAITTNMTIAFWFAPVTNNTSVQNANVVISRLNGGSDGQFYVAVSPTSTYAVSGRVVNDSSVMANFNSASLRNFDGLWHHVAVRWDGAYVQCYLDGKRDGTPVALTGSLKAGTWNTVLGNLGNPPNSNWSAYDWVDELRVWKRSLTDAEIARLALSPNIMFFPQQAAGPTAGSLGGVVGSVTNIEVRNVGGLLLKYWSDGTTLYSQELGTH